MSDRLDSIERRLADLESRLPHGSVPIDISSLRDEKPKYAASSVMSLTALHKLRTLADLLAPIGIWWSLQRTTESWTLAVCVPNSIAKTHVYKGDLEGVLSRCLADCRDYSIFTDDGADSIDGDDSITFG